MSIPKSILNKKFSLVSIVGRRPDRTLAINSILYGMIKARNEESVRKSESGGFCLDRLIDEVRLNVFLVTNDPFKIAEAWDKMRSPNKLFEDINIDIRKSSIFFSLKDVKDLINSMKTQLASGLYDVAVFDEFSFFPYHKEVMSELYNMNKELNIPILLAVQMKKDGSVIDISHIYGADLVLESSGDCLKVTKNRESGESPDIHFINGLFRFEGQYERVN